jgi:hypothetical protein
LSNCRLGWIIFGTSRLHKSKNLGKKIQARSDKKNLNHWIIYTQGFLPSSEIGGIFKILKKCALGFWHFGNWHHSALSCMITLKGLVLESCGTICSFIVLVVNMVVTHSYLSIIKITEKEGMCHCG